ncbi:hypothetical protein DSO57_1012728 [Entomophthora muscae]|uniref:Uncharacterized protein n=1 Tax=Entomophthora muscae TaxID=34485 RepID=A0ACC2U4C2_9FUNG|nr:hypothetical protein DSO57_1012728 [Entomophthora muscae]
MCRAANEFNKEHILTFLYPTYQEVVIPELPFIVTWEDMKRLLIEEFGGDLSLEVKKDVFMYIAFKPKETLAEFANQFYIEGQQLITSCQLTPWEAYTVCSNALKVNQLLCLHFKTHKASLTSMKSIKTLLQDMHLTHGGTMVCKNKANNAETTSCTTCIMTLGSSGQSKRQGCHNCGQIVRNIPDTYSCVTKKLSPAVNVKAPAATEQTSTANVQTSAATKQIHATTTWNPATTKLLPAINMQVPAATAQVPTTLASLCPPMPAGQSPSTPFRNSQIGKPGKAISPKPKLGGTAAQIGSLPNGELTDRLSNSENHAPNSVNEFGCKKKAQLALCQCKLGSSQTFSIASRPSQSIKGNNRCNSDSRFPNAMPSNNHAFQVH